MAASVNLATASKAGPYATMAAAAFNLVSSAFWDRVEDPDKTDYGSVANATNLAKQTQQRNLKLGLYAGFAAAAILIWTW